MIDLTHRIHDPEIMDDPSRPVPEFFRAYMELRAINRYLGGYRAVRRFLPRVEGGWLLDVGGGGCDVSDGLGSSGFWKVVALDRNRAGLGMSALSLPVQGDVFALPFADRSFDVVTASLLLHHMTDDDCVRALRDMNRVARRMLVVNDLHRALPAYLAIMGISRICNLSAMVRHDAPLSVRRAFRPSDLRTLGERAGLTFRLFRSFPYRLVLVVEK
jgi:2-polyprenyl-3-methyl-5-hydroxy-6-metoxy-1,4-benzoquinol methylase